MEFLESNPIVDVDFVVSDYCRKQYLSSSHDEEFCEAEAVAKKSEVASSRDSGEWAEFHSMCIQSFSESRPTMYNHDHEISKTIWEKNVFFNQLINDDLLRLQTEEQK